MITKALWERWIPIIPMPPKCSYSKFANARAAVWLTDNLRSEQNWLKALRVAMAKQPSLKAEIVSQIRACEQRIVNIRQGLITSELNDLGSRD